MINKHLVEEKSTLLKNKLQKLSKGLYEGSYQTEEALTAEVVRVLNDFYRDLNEPIFLPVPLSQNDLPDPGLYNKIWESLLDDLTILFTELENIEEITIFNFNFVQTESSRLIARLKTVASQLGDFILYSTNPTKDAFYYRDSFNDLERIEVNSPLLNLTQCEIDQDQGIVTLPINKEKDSIVKITGDPIINTGSNGTAGNNHELNAVFNGDPKVILDNNPDTWFEYENVVSLAEDQKEALVLDLTINLGEDTIINYIRINPNNFGTRTTISVDVIESSLDGKVYTSIKDDIPIGDFLTRDEENVFQLSPSTSKFAGQGIYSFTPRRAKYVHFIFKQSEPYVIDTSRGERLRYAIGIRDIDIRAFQYLPKGEIVSRGFEILNDSIRKVILDANQNPIEESSLCSIDYFISPDNGQSWHQIRPKSFEGFANFESEVPEILDFNGSSENTVVTEVPVQSIKLKATFTRNDEGFVDGSSAFRQRIEPTSEVHPIPESAPFEIELAKAPVDNTITIIDPLYGSRGIEQVRYVIGNASQTSGLIQRYYLPYNKMKRVYEKTQSGSNPVVYQTRLAPAEDWLHIAVGSEEWESATIPNATNTANYSTDPTYRVYEYNPNTGSLTFGSGHDTMTPPVGSLITAWLEPERLFPSAEPGAHSAKLDFPTSNDKSTFTIKRYDAVTSTAEKLPLNATVIHLAHKNITDLGTISTKLSAEGLTSQATFINGIDELTASTKWSIDTDEGIIYLGAPTPADEDITVKYSYQNYTELTEDEWDWVDGEEIRDSISIKDTAWVTIEADSVDLPVTEDIRSFHLPHFAIVKGSFEVTLLDGTDEVNDDVHPFLTEVPFQDGVKELNNLVVPVTEKVPALVQSSDRAFFDLQLPISTDTSTYAVNFTNRSIFVTELAAYPLVNVGDYVVDRDSSSSTYRRVGVKLSSSSLVNNSVVIQEAGHVTYFYTHPDRATTGLYSVDYEKGRIFTQRPMLDNTSWVNDEGNTVTRDWSLSVKYQYTDYRAEYPIARRLPSTSYEVSRTDHTIRFKDAEVLLRGKVSKEIAGIQRPYYQVNYDYVAETRDNIDELKDFFTPVLKDYVIKVVTKRQLI